MRFWLVRFPDWQVGLGTWLGFDGLAAMFSMKAVTSTPSEGGGDTTRGAARNFNEHSVHPQIMKNKFPPFLLKHRKNCETTLPPCQPPETAAREKSTGQGGAKHAWKWPISPKINTGTDFSASNHQGVQQWSRWLRTKLIISKSFSDMIFKIGPFHHYDDD